MECFQNEISDTVSEERLASGLFNCSKDDLMKQKAHIFSLLKYQGLDPVILTKQVRSKSWDVVVFNSMIDINTYQAGDKSTAVMRAKNLWIEKFRCQMEGKTSEEIRNSIQQMKTLKERMVDWMEFKKETVEMGKLPWWPQVLYVVQASGPRSMEGWEVLSSPKNTSNLDKLKNQH